MASSTHQMPFCEDANDETGSVVGGTKVSSSPRKEKSNTSRSRREKVSSRSSDSSTPHTDSDLATPPAALTPKRSKDPRPRSREREREREPRAPPRDKDRPRDSHRESERDRDRDERPRKARTVTIQTPPEPTKRSKPVLHSSSTSESQDAYRRPKGTIPDNPAHFGITPAGMTRPRTNSRPSSYYGAGSRPPASNERWHTMQQNQQPQQHPFAPSPYGTSPFAQPPPPLPMPPPGGYHMPPPGGYHMPPSPTKDYFTSGAIGGPVGSMSGTPTQHLHSRFALQRPSSASGYRQQQPPPPLPLPPPQHYDEYYEEDHFAPGGLARRPSVSRKEVEDRRQMPPPPLPRSMTAGPKPGGLFRPPPMVQPRRITHYTYGDDELETADNALYRDIVPPRSTSYSYGEANASQRRARKSSVTYDAATYQIEPATSTGRRHSYYGSSSGSVDYEDQIRQAEAYQGKVSGSQQVPLTKETLGKVGRPKRSSDKSSRSTRSSASRDESDYWNSNTTRTTRSTTGDGETSIRIKGGATLRVGDMEIQCPDGEIIINQDASTRGSDRGSTVWGDERPAPRRIDNVPYRARAPSQAASHSRNQLPGSYDSYTGHFP